MCGIVGYLGKGKAQEPLIDGLRRLEYRGYDSAGVAFHEGKEFSMSVKLAGLKTGKICPRIALLPLLALHIQDGPRMGLLLFQYSSPC